MINSLTLWINGVVAFILALAIFRKEIISLFKKTTIEIQEVKIDRVKTKLVLKTMKRCKNLLMSIVPDGENSSLPKFNRRERWSWDLVLTCAFMGPCRTYATDLATSKKWDTMSTEQFVEICQNEPKWMIDSVTQECRALLEQEPDAIPVPFEVLSLHNREKAGAECVELIIKHFTELRNL